MSKEEPAKTNDRKQSAYLAFEIIISSKEKSARDGKCNGSDAGDLAIASLG